MVVRRNFILNTGKYAELIHEGDPECKVVGKGSPLLAALVDRGDFNQHDINTEIRTQVDNILAREKVENLILGCTHYPFLSDAIRLTAGPGIRLIDPAPAVARQLKRRLDEPGLLNDTKKAPARIFCTTDANEARERILRLLWTDNAVLQELDGSVRP